MADDKLLLRMVPDFEDSRKEGGGREEENWRFGRELDDWARAGSVRSRGSSQNSGKPHFALCGCHVLSVNLEKRT